MVTLSSILPPVNVTTVSGTLAVTNGGTGVTTSTGTGSTVLSNSPTLVTPVLGAASATSVAAALGSVTAPSFTFTGDTNTGIWSPAADTIAFSEGGVEVMRITSGGDVGIGTASPTARFTVLGADAAQVAQFRAATGYLRVRPYVDATSGAFIDATNAAENAYTPLSFAGSSIRLTTNAGLAATVDASGNVGIGTASPSSKLTVAASNVTVNAGYGIAFTGDQNRILTPDDGVFGALIKWGATGGCRFFESTTERMRITNAGNVGIGTSSPAERLEVAGNLKITGSNLSIAPSTGTSAAYVLNTNTSGNLFCAIDSSTGAAFGAGNYARVLYSSGAYPLAFFTNDAERMRISSAGNVGIGTTSPTDLLTVANGSIASIISGSGANIQMGRIAMYSSALGAAYTNYGGEIRSFSGAGIDVSDLRFYTANAAATAERMRITNTGSVGIGTSSPSYLLHLNQNGNTQAWISATNSGSNSAGIGFENQGQRNWQIWADRTTDTLSFGQNSRASNYMSISGNGLVGIGTSSPAARLTVSLAAGSVAGGQLIVKDPNYSGVALVQGGSGEGYLWNTSNNFLSIATNNTERMRIDSAGLVSVNTTATLAQLTVAGTGGTGQVAGFRNTIYLRNNNTSGNQSSFIVFGSAGTVSSCFIGNDIQADGTTINRLDVQAGGSGGVYLASGGTSWTSASDERGKDIIEPISNATQKVGALRAVIGKYKTDADGTRRSFLIAQDVQAVLPEAVTVGTDDQHTLGVAYTDTIPLLVAAIKELTARVAQLEGN